MLVVEQIKEFDPTTMKLYSFSPQNLQALRKERNLTQAQLADKAGISRSSIGFYENGEANPTDDALRALGKALDVLFVCDWTDDEWEKETPRFKKKQG